MSARFDHLVVAVEDLDEAAARWSAAGLSPVRGGAHPVGTENVLVRGPEPAYVELIAAGSDDSNPWLDRVRAARGPISWAIAVDDIDTAREALLQAGFEPDPAVPGSRRTPDGDLVEWRVCDIGPGPYDGSLPFLIEWTTPMAQGPARGAIVEHVAVTPPDPDRVADLLNALGFVPSRHWPRRMFSDVDGAVCLTLGPPGEPEGLSSASWTMSWEEADEPEVSIAVALASGELTRTDLDGLRVTTRPDRRRFAAATLVPTVGSRDGLSRADAWVESIVASGLGRIEECDPAWARPINVEARRAVRVVGPPGTQPISVIWGSHPLDGPAVVVGVGDPVEVLERQPEHFPGTIAHQVGRIDDAFVLALSGGVYAVRGRRRSVIRALDGLSSSGSFAEGEAEQWLEQAAAGRRTEGVVAGDPWL